MNALADNSPWPSSLAANPYEPGQPGAARLPPNRAGHQGFVCDRRWSPDRGNRVQRDILGGLAFALATATVPDQSAAMPTSK